MHHGNFLLRGIAELCGVATPNMDTVINLASKALGKSFIEGGKMAGADIGMSRSPQAYGITTIDDLVKKLNYA